MDIPFRIAKCKTNAAYSAKLLRQGKLNLGKIKKTFLVILETPILLVVKVNGIEVIVHGYGELLFKNSADVPLLERIAEQIYAVGLEG